MKNFMRIPGYFVFLTYAPLFAQGGSAIITLVMPPPGGAGMAGLQTGAAFADGVESQYYNPAALAVLPRHTYSQLHYSRSTQNLLPKLNIPDLNQNFQTFSVCIPDSLAGFDFGLGFFKNHVNFGQDFTLDGNGNTTRSIMSYETVYALGFGIRLGFPVSIGGNVKYFESHLANGTDNIKPAKSWAFDVALLMDPVLRPFKFLKINSLEVNPSVGLAVQNLGPDVAYQDVSQSDPIPRTYRGGLGSTLKAADIIELRFSHESEREIIPKRKDGKYGITNSSFLITFLCFNYGINNLDDKAGRRFERHITKSVSINTLQIYKVWKRCKQRDFISSSESMEKGFSFQKVSLGKWSFRANPILTLGEHLIKSEGEGGLRKGQKSIYFGFSL